MLCLGLLGPSCIMTCMTYHLFEIYRTYKQADALPISYQRPLPRKFSPNDYSTQTRSHPNSQRNSAPFVFFVSGIPHRVEESSHRRVQTNMLDDSILTGVSFPVASLLLAFLFASLYSLKRDPLVSLPSFQLSIPFLIYLDDS